MHTLSRTVPLLAFGCLLLLAGTQLGALPNPTPSVTFHKLTPNMMVEDVNATVDFYRDVLGFDLVMTVPDSGRFDWALVRRDGIEMMFQTRASLSGDLPAFADRPLGGALTFYLDVEGIDALYRQLQARVAVVKELHETFYGTREFAIEDVNGFILTFAEAG
jgi:lactoylglutathione lyase